MVAIFLRCPALPACVFSILVATSPVHAVPSDGGADEHGHVGNTSQHGGGRVPDGEHDEGQEVHLSRAQQETLGVKTWRLTPQSLGDTLKAPGEVRLNAYATSQVTPRIAAQVLARHARLGAKVSEGQTLVSLSSVDMAEAQGDLIVAQREWQRLSKLKGQFVSERDYLEASVVRRTALSRVLAYGMTQSLADALVASASEKADGTFDLVAPQSGTVIRDQFVLGELVEPGRVLFEITDESVRWVEARMAPQEAARVRVGDSARVYADGVWLDGQVTQLHHQLDETTRTQAVRIEVPDPGHRLHPGIFADVEVYAGRGVQALAVPEAAVMRSPDGDWQVFVAGDEPGSYRPVEIRLQRTTGGLAVIDGLAPGTEVVVQGAFFLQSELAKSGFDIHNH